MTTKNGLSKLIHNPEPSLAQDAARFGPGATSMSNGSLMRITPIAVWAQNLPTEALEKIVKEDVSLMHSLPEMWNVCTAYCLAIKTLIKNAEDPNRAQMAL